jgi:hypothetical protein
MLLFAKTAFASPRWFRGARRFAGAFPRPPDLESVLEPVRELDCKDEHEDSPAAISPRRIFAPAPFGAPLAISTRTFALGADASPPTRRGASKSPPPVAQAFFVRFTPAVIVDFLGAIELTVTPAASPQTRVR